MLHRGDMILKMIRGKGWMTVPREHFLILLLSSLSFTIKFVSFLSSRSSVWTTSTRTADRLLKTER